MSKMSIEQLDPNFAGTDIGDTKLDFYDITEPPFAVYGFYTKEQGGFYRMSLDVAKNVNERVYQLAMQTSGGRIRFKTDSSKIAVRCRLPELHLMKHMPLTGSSFFDLYIDGKYRKPFYPSDEIRNIPENAKVAKSQGFVCVVDLGDKKMREVEINFPLYNSVSHVHIGLEQDAVIDSGRQYENCAPIVYYGSSITQGGCASHPGNAYANIISRRQNRDFINLGFSGNCKAEPIMADYISGLDMSVLVFDYDHNAPTAEFLEKTHEPFFKAFRSKRPDLPVVFVSVADRGFRDIEARRDVIYNTYRNALQAGDKNVYFIDGQTMYEQVGYDLCTVDNCHPNDLGFWCMANSIGAVLDEIFKKMEGNKI